MMDTRAFFGILALLVEHSHCDVLSHLLAFTSSHLTFDLHLVVPYSSSLRTWSVPPALTLTQAILYLVAHYAPIRLMRSSNVTKQMPQPAYSSRFGENQVAESTFWFSDADGHLVSADPSSVENLTVHIGNENYGLESLAKAVQAEKLDFRGKNLAICPRWEIYGSWESRWKEIMLSFSMRKAHADNANAFGGVLHAFRIFHNFTFDTVDEDFETRECLHMSSVVQDK